MALRPSGIPNEEFLPDPDAELRHAEEQVLAAELHWIAEAGRVNAATRELTRRLDSLKTSSGNSALAATIAARTERLALPTLALEHLAEARSIRQRALKARLEANEVTRTKLAAFAAEIAKVTAVIAAEEGALVAAERADREAAVVRAAAEQRARTSSSQLSPVADKHAATTRSVPPGLSKRENARVRMQAAIDLQSESNFFTGFSTNLSEGGIFVATVSHVKQGTPVDLSFTLPGGNRVDVKGVVRWSREVNDNTPEIFPGVGIQFTDLAPDVAEAITRFVSQREPLFYPD